MKTICIYHSIDQDGWMSAAIVKHWFIKANKKDYYILNENGSIDKTAPGISSNLLNFLGWNYGNNIPYLLGFDKVIMCDISFPKEEMLDLIEKLGANFIWIDHHQRAIDDVVTSNLDNLPCSGLLTIDGTKRAACELTWKYFFPDEPMPEIVRLLGLYDSFRHKGEPNEKEVLEFQYGARQIISNYEDAYKYLNYHLDAQKGSMLAFENSIEGILAKGKSIYQYLCTEAKQTYKNGFEIQLIEPLTTEERENNIYKFICFNKERFNPINFGIDYQKDGYDGAACFSYDGKQWTFSLYNDNGEVDCSSIAKQYGGGGHRGAAGFVTKDLEGFLLNHKI